MNFEFANTEFLLVFLILPVFLALKYYFWRTSRKRAVYVAVLEDLKKASSTFWLSKLWVRIIRYVLLLVIFVLFAVVLARPQGSYEEQKESLEGIDIVLALDVSESMLAEDLKPNRLEAAKNSINKFIDSLETDRLGIIVFSGQAFTQSPLTFDYNIIKEYISNISTDSINKNVRGLSGTAIGDAILAGVNRLDGDKDRTRVLVVLTDGDANTGINPPIAATKARQEGIKVYTVGIGKEGGAPIPGKDFFGRRDYLRNRDGSLFMATFQEEKLQELSRIGGGKYFRVTNENAFRETLREIGNLEKKEIEVEVSTIYTENFEKYLIGLFVAMVVYFVFVNFVDVRQL